MSDTLRCFVGIPLGGEVVSWLFEAAEAIRSADPAWRGEKWVAEPNLHITVKFLGNLEAARINELDASVSRGLASQVAFELPFAGVRAVPNPRRCRMLWASCRDPDGECAALASEVERQALAFGVALERRPFVPHATLCRARTPKRLGGPAQEAVERLLDGAPESMSVPSATLFSSRLTPRGPIYDAVATWRLLGE